MQKHICIIGNGIAGITAARHIRKLSDHKITVISSESKYFYSRTALMYIYMGHMKYEHTKPYEDWFWTKNRIELVFDYVKQVDFLEKTLVLNDSKPIVYDELIIATGSKPNRLGWPGQDLSGVSGMYSIQDLESIENSTQNIKDASIIGGGLIGIELAEMLLSRKINVNFLVREKRFWSNILPVEESKLVEREIIKHGVNLLLNNELEEIIGDENSWVKGIKTKNRTIYKCQFVGLTAGVSPNISFLQNTDLDTDRGVRVNEFLQTNVANVWAIGDCAEHISPPNGRRNIEQIWYTGKIMGETVAKSICTVKTKYEPGLYYNSAKFFDIEYSVYGNITNEKVSGIETFYWENKVGNKCLRIAYTADNQVVTGIHAFGIRLRAEVCKAWIVNKTKLETVLSELEKANFNPEFSKSYLQKIKFNNFIVTQSK
jgi:NAD(P)H-nitrite reductase large subunit